LRPSLSPSPASSTRSAAIRLHFHFSSICCRRFSIFTSRLMFCESSADAAGSSDPVGRRVGCRLRDIMHAGYRIIAFESLGISLQNVRRSRADVIDERWKHYNIR
jgi:hypothetical protein